MKTARTRHEAPGPAGDRRRELERRLAAAGLVAGPRRPAAFGGVAEPALGARLREALAALGPVFSAFGLYLASRPDLLSPPDCLELRDLPDHGEPTPPAAVRELLQTAVGSAPEEVFAPFDPRPVVVRCLGQTHRAALADGTPVEVRLVHPRLAAQLELDLPLLPRLLAAVAEAGGPELPAGETVADFRAGLEQELDLAAEAEALAALAAEASSSGLIAVPHVMAELSSARVLVHAELAGAISQLAPGPGSLDHPVDRARRLCLVWLRQALFGQVVPLDVRTGKLALLAGGRVAFLAGPFARPRPAEQEAFFRYLVAASRQRPEEAADELARGLVGGGVAGLQSLRLQLRQAVPFRDGAWSAGAESLAEHLFVHWRMARDCDFRPSPALLAAWRGLASVATLARSLAPDRDALAEALEEVRLIADMGRLRELGSWQRLGDTMERYAELFASLPQSLDVALTQGAQGRQRPPAAPRRAEPAAASGWGLLAAGGLGLAAVAGLVQQLSTVRGGAPWAEPVAAVVFALLGALWLRALNRAD